MYGFVIFSDTLNSKQCNRELRSEGYVVQNYMNGYEQDHLSGLPRCHRSQSHLSYAHTEAFEQSAPNACSDFQMFHSYDAFE